MERCRQAPFVPFKVSSVCFPLDLMSLMCLLKGALHQLGETGVAWSTLVRKANHTARNDDADPMLNSTGYCDLHFHYCMVSQ
jgi:hypothetical protein